MRNVRYYDYGVMRREADRRMYDAQRRAGANNTEPTRRVTYDPGEQTRPEPGSMPTCTQDAIECDVEESAAAVPEPCVNPCIEPVQPKTRVNTEELLILALLVLTLSEGNNFPLALVLLYLLM